MLFSNRGLCLELGGFEQLSSKQYHRVGKYVVMEERADLSCSQWKRAVTAVGEQSFNLQMLSKQWVFRLLLQHAMALGALPGPSSSANKRLPAI